MKTAIVIDSSIEFPPKWYDLFNIFPIGYVIKDDMNNKLEERVAIKSLRTSELRDILKKNKHAQLLAPAVKDFVELYTFLSEDFDHIISVHSSLFTPAVFENAILAKKLVSEITIDIIDTHTISSASALFLDFLSHAVLSAQKINDIRKAAVYYDKHINSYIIAKNDQLHVVGIRKTSWLTGLTVTLRPNVLYRYYNLRWHELSRSRSTKGLINEINARLNLYRKAKEPTRVYLSSEGDLKEIKDAFEATLKNIEVIETEPSLVSSFLLNHNFFSIAIY